MTWREDRQRSLELRFPKRESLTYEQLQERYFADLDRVCVINCLSVMERELKLQLGFMRPEDSLSLLFVPVRTLNPLRWLLFRGLEGDSQAELAHLLKLRAKDTYGDLEHIHCLDDYVRAWCKGKAPIAAAM